MRTLARRAAPARWQTAAMAKIAIIGAGSVEFTRNILTDLGSYPELHGTLQLALHDIDEERLAYAERTANQVVERLGAGYTVSAHADRREAFDGADYLINEIQVGGYRATVTDFEIPTRYGLRQTIADTIGIGGIMRGLRTIPVMIEMGDEMAALCPEGLLLNYTNPMAMVPWGIWAGSRWPAARTIGVCHSVRDTHAFLASLVGLPEDTGRVPHGRVQPPVLRLRVPRPGERRRSVPAAARHRGRPTPRGSVAACASRSTSGSATSQPRVERALERVRAVVPAPPRPGREVPLRDRRVHPAQRREPRGVGGAEGAAGRRRPRSRSSTTTSWRRSSCSRSRPGEPIELYGNVRNDALIDGLPADACVEVPVTVADGAVQPQRIGPIPPQCLALNRTFLNTVELTVRAVVEGSRDHVYQAALLDPHTGATLTTEQIVNMVDELIEAHGDLIPEAIRRG